MNKRNLFQKIGLESDSAGNNLDSNQDGKASAPRIIEEDAPKRLTIAAAFGINAALYDQALEVRKDENGVASKFDFDAWSTHYVMFHESEPIGALTATQQKHGPVDCNEFYPQVLFQRYSDVLVSICKFRILPGSYSGMATFRTMVRAVWRDLLQLGVRIDVINIEKSNLAAFRRIGYVIIKDSEFIHPKLGTDSIAMVLSADPTHKSFFADLFETEIDDPVLMADVLQAIETTQSTDTAVSKKSSADTALSMPTREHSDLSEDKWKGYDDYQNGSSRRVQEYYEAVNHCLSLALHQILSKRGKLALDIACGAGTSTRIISRFSDRVIGVDSSPELIQLARSEQLGERFEFIESRFEDYQCEDEKFDLISASWFLNYLDTEEDLASFFARVASLLRPGGCIAFVVPSASYATDTTQAIAREEFDWQQATLEMQPEYSRVVFSYGNDWIKTTIWQPLKLMRMLDQHFHIQAWDVKATLAYERRLQILNTEPPFEVIYGTLRQKGGK